MTEEVVKSLDQSKKDGGDLARAKTVIQSQHVELDRLEQYSRRDSLRILGLPESDNPAQEETAKAKPSWTWLKTSVCL